MGESSIPASLAPHFQEYEFQALDPVGDANLIIQRTLGHGSWREIRWLFRKYGAARIRQFVRERGERMLSPVAFNYWRKLFGIHDWRPSPFPTARSEVWAR